MKKFVIVLLLTTIVLGGIFATDINVEGRLGMGYFYGHSSQSLGSTSSASIYIQSFDISIGADAYCFKKNNFEFGFNAHYIHALGKQKTIAYVSGTLNVLDEGFYPWKTLFFGPVFKYNFTDKISARFAMGYYNAESNTTIGCEISGDYGISDKVAVGLEFKWGLNVGININATATYKF